MLELEEDFIDGNFELPLESQPTVQQKAHMTAKNTRKHVALAVIDSTVAETTDMDARKSQKRRKR